MIEKIEQLLAKLPPGDQERLIEQLNEYKQAVEREKCQDSFMAFVKKMWPGFIHGRHHAVMAKAFEDIASGKLKRLAISMPPRHTKSQFGSYLFPAWFLGKFPNKKIIQASNTAELAVGFGRNVRNLVMSDQYADVFPDVRLRQDSKAAGRWSTNHGGEAFSIGVGGTMTGRGGDCLVGNTMIMTYNGLKRIDEIKPNEHVLSYCEASHRAVYRKVVAVAQRQAFDTYQVRDRLGNMVEATGNHRIYYEGGWTPAEAIAVGGSILSYLPEFFSKGAVRASEKVCRQSELHSGLRLELRNSAEESAGRHEVCGHMQELRKRDVGQPIAEKGVLGRVQERVIHQTRIKKSHGGRKALRYLRRLLQACNKYVREQVLLREVQERPSCNGDEGGKQSRLEGRHFAGARKVQGSTRFSIGKTSRTEDG